MNAHTKDKNSIENVEMAAVATFTQTHKSAEEAVPATFQNANMILLCINIIIMC